jgi:hypothetical protein
MRQNTRKRQIDMKNTPYILILLATAASGFCMKPLAAQDASFQLIDFVEAPAQLQPAGERNCMIEFGEQWTFLDKGALSKEVRSQKFSCSEEPRDLAIPGELLRIKNIRYEFMLLDPHLLESNNQAFAEADSMDKSTRELQGRLIELIGKYISMDSRYDPRQELLSVYFHEEWILDPESPQIIKKVKGITPVIWQRRKTTEGKSINDGDTGLPVYYKNPLRKITLRQP